MIVYHGNHRLRYGYEPIKNGRLIKTGGLDRMGSRRRAIHKLYGSLLAWAMIAHPEWFEDEEA